VIGAVTIPERHAILKDEDVRILDKVSSGVSFFISQCIFNVDYTKKMLEALSRTCLARDQKLPTMIFTLTVCGSVKTLEFMEWLGIHVPEDIKADLIASEDPAKRSVQIAVEVARELIRFCKEHAIPFGFNIESVATRKAEVEASLELLTTVRELLKESSFR
jgi:5,10-methylenetetrahydrofolate reductase